MDDTISRAAAIETVRKAKSIGQAHRMLLQLPSAQPTGTNTVQVDDCISRQAALDALPKKQKGIGGESWMKTYRRSGYNDCVEDCMKALQALPSVQPGWIPVTERLPEYGTTVLTCDHDGEYEINHIIDEEDGEWFLDGAVAWIPIPKPWEGDANG